MNLRGKNNLLMKKYGNFLIHFAKKVKNIISLEFFSHANYSFNLFLFDHYSDCFV